MGDGPATSRCCRWTSELAVRQAPARARRGSAEAGRSAGTRARSEEPASDRQCQRASAVVQAGPPGGLLRGSRRPPSSRRPSAASGRAVSFQVRRRGVDEAFAAVRVDEDVAVGVVDVVGERRCR